MACSANISSVGSGAAAGWVAEQTVERARGKGWMGINNGDGAVCAREALHESLTSTTSVGSCRLRPCTFFALAKVSWIFLFRQFALPCHSVYLITVRWQPSHITPSGLTFSPPKMSDTCMKTSPLILCRLRASATSMPHKLQFGMRKFSIFGSTFCDICPDICYILRDNCVTIAQQLPREDCRENEWQMTSRTSVADQWSSRSLGGG